MRRVEIWESRSLGLTVGGNTFRTKFSLAARGEDALAEEGGAVRCAQSTLSFLSSAHGRTR